MQATAKLELAQYILKSDGLMLHPEFLQRLRSLPQAYVYGEYRQIYRDYGTHYVTEAALGGDYEHTIILNKEKLEKTGSLNTWFQPLLMSSIKPWMLFIGAQRRVIDTIHHLGFQAKSDWFSLLFHLIKVSPLCPCGVMVYTQTTKIFSHGAWEQNLYQMGDCALV